jgi:hypothetical protein
MDMHKSSSRVTSAIPWDRVIAQKMGSLPTQAKAHFGLAHHKKLGLVLRSGVLSAEQVTTVHRDFGIHQRDNM